MEFKDLRFIRIPDESCDIPDESCDSGYSDCFKITKTETDEVIWWCPVTITYQYQTNRVFDNSTETIYYGQDANPPEMPTRIDDYYAKDWNTTLNNITGDITATFIYDQKFTVTFKNDYQGGELISASMFPAYSAVLPDVYPNTSFKKYYSFNEWQPKQIDRLDKDTTVIAHYTKNEITIRDIKSVYKYDGNDHPFVVSAEITNGITPSVKYSRTGNDGDWSSVVIHESVADTKISVYYKITGFNTEALSGCGVLQILPAEVFNVTFSYLGTDYSSQTTTKTVEYGKSAKAPNLPYLDEYAFEKWSASFDRVTSNMYITASYVRRTISCNVYSSLSTSHETLTCLYGDLISPIARCDNEPAGRWAMQYWYTYSNDVVREVTTSELEEFKQNELSIYPYYRRLYNLSTYAVSFDKTLVEVSTNILSGSDVMSSELSIPDVDGFTFQKIYPETWNPINSDTELCLIYSKNEFLFKRVGNPLMTKGSALGEGFEDYADDVILGDFKEDAKFQSLSNLNFADQIELVFLVRTGSDVASNQEIFAGFVYDYDEFGVYDNKFMWEIVGGSSKTVGTHEALPSTWYWVKLVKGAGSDKFSGYVSKPNGDETTLELDCTGSRSSTIKSKVVLGIDPTGSSDEHWRGYINLSKSYFRINGVKTHLAVIPEIFNVYLETNGGTIED